MDGALFDGSALGGGSLSAAASGGVRLMTNDGRIMLDRTEGQVFRERVGFLVLCVIGAYCSMRILIELKSILEPFLWALFLVMAWKPVVDNVERQIDAMLVFLLGILKEKGIIAAGHSPSKKEDLEGEMQCLLEEQDMDPSTRDWPKKKEMPDGLGSLIQREEPPAVWRRRAARGIAVLITMTGMFGILSGFGLLIVQSARRMQEHWDVYQKGAENLTNQTNLLFQAVPDNFLKQYQDLSDNMVKTAQDFLYALLGNFVNNVSSLLLGGLLTLLYTLFWLCSPVPMSSSIDVMFRRYILLKTLACLGYGLCIGMLLSFMAVDLAAVFALANFALGYVPEVGPFVAMVLPCPVILLDSRLERPMLTMLTTIAGQMALKFAFSNVIEVRLIESDAKLRMHPVMILLSVGIFGYLWGPTGMLLSVPLMALVKVSLFSELVPASYRDPILVILEGDRDAPRKHGLTRQGGTGNSSGQEAGRHNS